MWHIENLSHHLLACFYLLHNFGSYWLKIFDISNIAAFRGFPGNCNNSSHFHQKCPWTLLPFSLYFVTCAKGKRPETSGPRLLWIVWWGEVLVSCKLLTRLMSLQFSGSLLFVGKRGLHVQSWVWSLQFLGCHWSVESITCTLGLYSAGLELNWLGQWGNEERQTDTNWYRKARLESGGLCPDRHSVAARKLSKFIM